MKIRPLLFLLLIVLAFACKPKTRIFSKQQYADIILDLQLAETIISDSNVSNKDSLRKEIQNRICEIYGFSGIPQLKSSLKPLEHQPDLMLDITKLINIKLDMLADSAIAYPQ